MAADDLLFAKGFYQNLRFEPLDPDDALYVPLWQDKSLIESDPVELLARGIEWSPGGGVQLFSGFRGCGKSTELRRLKKRLQAAGFLVALIDVEDHVNLTTPIDVSDFLLALSSALGEVLGAPELLGENAAEASFWERLAGFLKRIRVEELGVEAGGAGVKASIKGAIKQDPTFKARLQKRLEGHVTELCLEVQAFFTECVRRLVQKHGPRAQLVVLVDSLERIRGTSTNGEEVHASVETLFAGHADKLRFDGVHLVYTVPPYLKVLYPSLQALFGTGDVVVLPSVKVHDQQGRKFKPGLDQLERVVTRRGSWDRLLGDRAVLDELVELSGGHFRDFFRLLAETLLRVESLPVPRAVVDAVIGRVRDGFLPLADNDAVWLQRVADTHDTGMFDRDKLPELARFLETHLIFCYRNGKEWYDVHPLIKDQVRSQSARTQVGDRIVQPEG